MRISHANLHTKLLPFAPLLVLIGLLELASFFGWLDPYLFPSPTMIAATFIEEPSLWLSAWRTLWTASLGFLLSGLIGMSLGIAFSSSRLIQRLFLPYAVFFQTVPIIAIAPLLVIWIGYGAPTVIASVFIVSVFPMIASTLSGIQSTEPALIDLFRVYGGSRPKILWSLQIPSALPQIFTGLRIAAGLAVIGAIVGEFIAGGGLGGWIDVARTRQRVDHIFAALLLATTSGLLFIAIINQISSAFLKQWHPSGADED
jgi:NitT/TauT family transport system permease protein